MANCWGSDFLETVLCIVVIVGLIICLPTTARVGAKVVNLKVIDSQMQMYENENQELEQKVSTAVEKYIQHEQMTFSDLKPDEAMAYVSLYPELKSDALVQQEVNLYISNIEEIKQLKEEKIKGDVYRWWLYFGKSKKES